MRYFLVSCVFVLYSSSVLGDEKFPGIKKLMSKQEFFEAGLDKQSEEELEALNRWLIRYTARDAEMVKVNVKAVKDEAKKEIRSRIAGDFVGWDGETIFKLENGQVWKQRIKGNWNVEMENPEVLIKRNLFGFYEMIIVEKKKRIGVKRVK